MTTAPPPPKSCRKRRSQACAHAPRSRRRSRKETPSCRAILSFLSGNAVAQTWQRLWFAVKAALVLGAVVFAVSELTQQTNHAVFSYAKSAGEGAQGEALTADQVRTRQEMNAGREVSGAKRRAVVDYEGQAANADKTRAEADAYKETEAQLLAKKTLNIPLTTTEDLRLIELQTRRAEATQKIAAAKAAEAMAKANRQAAEMNSRIIESLQKGDGAIWGEMMKMVVPKDFLNGR